MGGVGTLQDLGASGDDRLGVAGVDVGRGQQRDPRVVVLLVVVQTSRRTRGSTRGVLDAAEPVGEGGVVLEGLELALRVGVVVRDVRSGTPIEHGTSSAPTRG
jgi:hypothetical protein